MGPNNTNEVSSDQSEALADTPRANVKGINVKFRLSALKKMSPTQKLLAELSAKKKLRSGGFVDESEMVEGENTVKLGV